MNAVKTPSSIQIWWLPEQCMHQLGAEEESVIQQIVEGSEEEESTEDKQANSISQRKSRTCSSQSSH